MGGFAGCRSSSPQATYYNEKIAQENRLLEDQLYAADFENQKLFDEVLRLKRENARLKAGKSPSSSSDRPAFLNQGDSPIEILPRPRPADSFDENPTGNNAQGGRSNLGNDTGGPANDAPAEDDPLDFRMDMVDEGDVGTPAGSMNKPNADLPMQSNEGISGANDDASPSQPGFSMPGNASPLLPQFNPSAKPISPRSITSHGNSTARSTIRHADRFRDGSSLPSPYLRRWTNFSFPMCSQVLPLRRAITRDPKIRCPTASTT